MREFPNSAYAHAAQAWVKNTTAWNIRGELVVSKTYHRALHEFSDLINIAVNHATVAYETKPRFIPASDAMISFGNGSSKRATSFEVLDQVMTTDPNMGTVLRALALSLRGWGGTYAQAEDMCNSYAPGLEYRYDPLTRCRLAIWQSYYPKELSQWAYELLSDTNIPHLEEYRMRGIVKQWGWRGEQDAEFSYAYLTRDDIVWSYAAEAFDLNIPHKYGYPHIYESHLHKSIAVNQERLKTDPFNPGLIDLIRNKTSPGLRINYTGRPLAKEISLLTLEDDKELVRRQLVSSPYQSSHWWAMTDLMLRDASPEDLLKADPYLINAVVYSNHGTSPTKRLMQTKFSQYELVQKMKSGETTGDWKQITSDVDGDILCPFIRARRVYDSICPATEGNDAPACSYTKGRLANLELAMQDAKLRNVCTKERFAPVSLLYYAPVDADVSGQSGG